MVRNWYQRGQYIFQEGNPVLGIYFIHHGDVKITSTGINGRQYIIRLATDGDIVGHRGYGNDKYSISVVALREDSMLCFIENSLLYETFMKNPKFNMEVMMFYSKELRKTEIRLKYHAQMNVREKIAGSLLYILESFRLNEKPKDLVISLSRDEIAGIAGTNAEQVSRTIVDFKSEGILSTEGRSIIIHDPDKLKEMIIKYEHIFG